MPMKIYFVLTRYQSNAKRDFSLSRPQEFLIYFLFLLCNRANLKRSLPVSHGFLQHPFQPRLTSPAANKTLQKEPPAALGESKLEVQVAPGGWFCNKPAPSSLSLSLFIQQVFPIPRTPNAVILEGDWPKFSCKAPAKGRVSLGRARQVEQKGRFTLGAKR